MSDSYIATTSGHIGMNSVQKVTFGLSAGEVSKGCSTNKEKPVVPTGKKVVLVLVKPTVQKDFNLLYRCEICKMPFTSSSNCSVHMRKAHNTNMRMMTKTLNTTEKQFNCTMCRSSFNGKSGLALHMLTHKDSFPQFACSVCGVSYSNNKALMWHMKAHKPHDLELKRIANSGKNSASDHIEEESCFEPVMCQHCKNVYRSKYALGTHKCLHLTWNQKNARFNRRVEHASSPVQCYRSDPKILQSSDYQPPTSLFGIPIAEVPSTVTRTSCDSKQDLNDDRHFHDDVSACLQVPSSLYQDSVLEPNILLDTETPSEHLEATSEEKLFKCFICDDYFASKDEVLDHLKMHSETLSDNHVIKIEEYS